MQASTHSSVQPLSDTQHLCLQTQTHRQTQTHTEPDEALSASIN